MARKKEKPFIDWASYGKYAMYALAFIFLVVVVPGEASDGGQAFGLLGGGCAVGYFLWTKVSCSCSGMGNILRVLIHVVLLFSVKMVDRDEDNDEMKGFINYFVPLFGSGFIEASIAAVSSAVSDMSFPPTFGQCGTALVRMAATSVVVFLIFIGLVIIILGAFLATNSTTLASSLGSFTLPDLKLFKDVFSGAGAAGDVKDDLQNLLGFVFCTGFGVLTLALVGAVQQVCQWWGVKTIFDHKFDRAVAWLNGEEVDDATGTITDTTNSKNSLADAAATKKNK